MACKDCGYEVDAPHHVFGCLPYLYKRPLRRIGPYLYDSMALDKLVFSTGSLKELSKNVFPTS